MSIFCALSRSQELGLSIPVLDLFDKSLMNPGFCWHFRRSPPGFVPSFESHSSTDSDVCNLSISQTALGFPNIDGHSGKKRGVTITPSIINPANSSRSNSLAGYIVPNDYRPNLVILT